MAIKSLKIKKVYEVLQGADEQLRVVGTFNNIKEARKFFNSIKKDVKNWHGRVLESMITYSYKSNDDDIQSLITDKMCEIDDYIIDSYQQLIK